MQGVSPRIDPAIVAASLWLIIAVAAVFHLASREVVPGEDQIFWFSLQNPGGGELSYPALANGLFRLLHSISGENLDLFAQLAAGVSLIAFLLLFLVFFRMGIPAGRLAVLSLAVLPVFVLVLSRIDIVAVFLSALGVFLFLKGKRMEGWLSIFAGALFKVFPLFFAPLFLAMELKNFNRDALVRISILCVLSILTLLVFEDNLRTVFFHSARGIQVESIYANILSLADMVLPLNLEAEYNYGSRHLVLPESLGFLVPLSLLAQFGLVLWASFLFWKAGAKKEQLVLYSFLVATAMVIGTKIFSTQFILWPLLFAIPVLHRMEGKLMWKMLSLFFVLALLTNAVSPLFWEQMLALEPGAVFLLTARNALLIGIFAWFVRNREKISAEY